MIKEIVEFVNANQNIEVFLDAKINGYFIYLNLKDIKNAEVSVVKSKNNNFMSYNIDNAKLVNQSLNSNIQKVLYYAKVYSKGKNNNFQAFNKIKSLDSTSPFFMKVDFDFDGTNIVFYKFDKKLETNDDKTRRLPIKENINAHFQKAYEFIDDEAYKYFLQSLQDKISDIISDMQHNETLKELLYQDLLNKKNKNKIEKETIYICIDVGIEKQLQFDKFYLKEKAFGKKLSEMNFEKAKCNGCGQLTNITAPLLFTNYDNTFAMKQLGIGYNFKVCQECASKLIKFWELTKLGISNPLPLILYKNENEVSAFRDVFRILDENKQTKKYRDIIKELYSKYPKSLKNYYLISFKFAGPQKKLFIDDIDYVENFKYMTNFIIYNYLDIKYGFVLKDFYDKRLNVFQFEKILDNLIFDNKLIGNYFTDYSDNKLKITYWKINSSNSNSLLKNYLIKYRQNLYDFIYKSHELNLQNIYFREMLIDIIEDNIKHDNNDKNGYSIYENEILEKLNLLFSIKHYFKNGGEKVEQDEFKKLKADMQNSIGHYEFKKDNEGNFILDENKNPKKEYIGGADFIENNDKLFAFICGQIARYLIRKSKKKDENKNHSDFSGFTDWQSSKLLKEYIFEIHKKYAHELKFYKNYDNAMCIIQTYRDDVDMDSVMEYMVAGYFAENLFYKNIDKEEKENE